MKLNNVHHDVVIPRWCEIVLMIILALLSIWNLVVLFTYTFTAFPVICYAAFILIILISVLGILYESKRVYNHKDISFKLFTIFFAVTIALLSAISIAYHFGWIHIALFILQLITLLGIIFDKKIVMEKSYVYGISIFNEALFNLIVFAFRAPKVNDKVYMTSIFITNLFLGINLLVMLYSRYHYRKPATDRKTSILDSLSPEKRKIIEERERQKKEGLHG